MTPADIRDHTFLTIRAQLSGRLEQVYDAWLHHGPATTRQLAKLSGIDILNVRPRTTDLCAIGLVRLVGHHGGEGVYEAASRADWDAFAAASRASRDSQLHLL